MTNKRYLTVSYRMRYHTVFYCGTQLLCVKYTKRTKRTRCIASASLLSSEIDLLFTSPWDNESLWHIVYSRDQRSTEMMINSNLSVRFPKNFLAKFLKNFSATGLPKTSQPGFPKTSQAGFPKTSQPQVSQKLLNQVSQKLLSHRFPKNFSARFLKNTIHNYCLETKHHYQSSL